MSPPEFSHSRQNPGSTNLLNPEGTFCNRSMRLSSNANLATNFSVLQYSSHLIVWAFCSDFSLYRNVRLRYLEQLLDAVHLGAHGVDDTLPVLQHELLQLLHILPLLQILQQASKRCANSLWNYRGGGADNKCEMLRARVIVANFKARNARARTHTHTHTHARARARASPLPEYSRRGLFPGRRSPGRDA